MGTSYPPPHEGYTFSKLSPPPRDLLPIYPPQEPLVFPALPSPTRDRASFDAPYRLSTHLVPAAYLRTAWNAPVPDVRGDGVGTGVGAKEERVRMMERVYEAICDNCVYAGAGTDGHPAVLWNCVNRYVREEVHNAVEGGGGATLFLAHATGFPKEVSWLNSLTKV